jgi:hypothetical protein
LKTIGIIAYGSLIQDPGADLQSAIIGRKKKVLTPFSVEFARKSKSRNYSPTLIPVQRGGNPVYAQILILREGIDEGQAKDLLWRRETHQTDKGKKYPDKKNPTINDVVIETLRGFHGLDVVLYTKIAPNIEPLTPQELAQLAIDSAKPDLIKKNLDGISYLMQVKNDGIKTPLMDDYEKELLTRLGAKKLDICLFKVISSLKEKGVSVYGSEDEAKLLGLFGHLSRMYNSTINALIAFIFGWATFIGLAVSLKNNVTLWGMPAILAIVAIAIFIILMAYYLFARTLQFDKYIAKMASDLNLGNYVSSLPKTWLLSRINKRTKENVYGLTSGQKAALILMTFFFIISLVLLLYQLGYLNLEYAFTSGIS